MSSSISRVVCTCVVACYAWGTKYCSQRRLNEWKYYLYAIWWCVAYHSSLPQLACSILTTTYQYCFSAQYNTTRQEYRARLYFKKDPGPGRAVQPNQEWASPNLDCRMKLYPCTTNLYLDSTLYPNSVVQPGGSNNVTTRLYLTSILSSVAIPFIIPQSLGLVTKQKIYWRVIIVILFMKTQEERKER